MAAQTQPAQPPAQPAAQTVDPAKLLEQILEKQPSERYRTLDIALQTRISKVEELLPPTMKGQGERLVKRAMLTFAGKPGLEECTAVSFVKCVLQAAELGLAIDGRLAHAVPYNNRKKDDKGNWTSTKESQLQVDYKGIVAVAKRTKQIKDVYARIVHEADQFDAYDEDGKCHLVFRPALTDQGPVKGAFAIIRTEDDWRYEWMNLDELNKVRAMSKSFNPPWKDAKPSGPWVDWPEEMQKKTVIKRALKMYCEDPAIVRLLEIDDEDTTPLLDEIVAAVGDKPPIGRQNLRVPKSNNQPEAPLPTNGNGHAADDQAQPPPPENDDNMAAKDTYDMLCENVQLAEDARDMPKIQADIVRAHDLLGDPLYQDLNNRWNNKMQALAPGKGKKG